MTTDMEHAQTDSVGAARLDAAISHVLRPPPEHADKPQHWLQFADHPPLVWMWETHDSRHPDGIWCHPSGDLYFPACMGTSLGGYRYLGPAEWRPDLNDALITAMDQRVADRDIRIAELETELARLKGADAAGGNAAGGAHNGPRKGDFVTCERGHLICEVAETPSPSEYVLPYGAILDHWRSNAVRDAAGGYAMHVCECGAAWGRPSRPHGLSLHIKGRGWVRC